jgi:hypothetical protein
MQKIAVAESASDGEKAEKLEAAAIRRASPLALRWGQEGSRLNLVALLSWCQINTDHIGLAGEGLAMKAKFFGIAAALALFSAVSPASGQSVATFDSRWQGHPSRGFDSTILTARPATGDVVDWGQIGTPNLIITTPQSFTSTGGTTGTVSLNGTGFLVQQCCIGITGTFDGDFAPGDKHLFRNTG